MCQVLTVSNYKLLRKIGEGGFGIVWLAQKMESGEFFALKEITSENISGHEIRALKLYAKKLKESSFEGVVPILDIIMENDKVYYTMPLCDGVNGTKPTDPNYTPLTLYQFIEERRKESKWFSKEEIEAFISPIISAAGEISKAELLHRDIKPANILFFNGKPCLGDIGLLTEDNLSVKADGTPGFSAPEWYTRSLGNPDMWGCATTLFYLLTGNSPDLIGRVAYHWQPCGKEAMSLEDVEVWQNFINVINRTTSEAPKERYFRFDDLKKAINAVVNGYKTEFDYPIWVPYLLRVLFARISELPAKFRYTVYAGFIGVITSLIFLGFYLVHSTPEMIVESTEIYYENLWKATGNGIQKQYDKLLRAKTDDEKMKCFDKMKNILLSPFKEEETLEKFCLYFSQSQITEHHNIKLHELLAKIVPIYVRRNQIENIDIINNSLLGRYCFVKIDATNNDNVSELEKLGYKLMTYSEAVSFKSRNAVAKRRAEILKRRNRNKEN